MSVIEEEKGDRATLSAHFCKTMLDLHGDAGIVWIQQLPALLTEYAERWQVQLGSPYDLSYNYVAPGTGADGTPVVIKAGVPEPEFERQIEALRLYHGEGCIRLLEADKARGVMLLERVAPGTPLSELPDDEEATRIAARIMRQLWRPLPPDNPFRPIEEWFEGLHTLRAMFEGGTGPLPTPIVEEAESWVRDLFASPTARVLLHGDLHHYNILKAEREPWLMIDPKGMTGDPAYEIGMFLLNPFDLLERPNPSDLLARRIAIFAEELGFERERLRGWGIAHAVLSAWWSVEDHGEGWEGAIACAQYLSAMSV